MDETVGDGEETVVTDGVRYLVSRVGPHRIAISMGLAREVIQVRQLTRLPGSPDWVSGLLNLRGTVLTVIDLAKRLGLSSSGGLSVVVLEVDGRSLGVRVERVEGVVSSEDSRIDEVEEARQSDGLVAGVVRLADGTALLLDAEALVRSVLATA